MSCFWLPSSAIVRSTPCRNPRPLLQICHTLASDRLPTKLPARFPIRDYSISSIPFRRRDYGQQGAKGWKCANSYQIRRWKTTSSKKVRPPTDGTIIDFADLPKNYEDEIGLSFRAMPLSRDELKQIFGGAIEEASAHHLLRVIHGRRVAGTLEDPNLLDMSSQYEREIYNAALKWLRDNIPVDEVKNAGLSAEKELEKMQSEIVEDAERIGLYKPNSGEYDKTNGGVYGKGAFDHIRETKEEKAKELEAQRKSQADEIKENTGPLAIQVNPNFGITLNRPPPSAKMLERLEKGKVTPDNTPLPQKSVAKRLVPSSIFLFVLLGGCYLFAEAYEPPKKSARLWPDMPSSAACLIGIILINTAIFLAWKIPPFWRTLNTYFIHTPSIPVAASLLGNTFSHQSLGHLATNMFFAFLLGTRLHDEIGRGPFLAVYIAGGAIGTYASLVYRVATSSFITSSLGASGSVCAIMGCYFMLHSGEKVKIFGVFPPDNWPSLTSLFFLMLLMVPDVLALVTKKRFVPLGTDHWAHLGGFATGITSALLIRDGARKRKELELAKKKKAQEEQKGLLDIFMGK